MQRYPAGFGRPPMLVWAAWCVRRGDLIFVALPPYPGPFAGPATPQGKSFSCNLCMRFGFTVGAWDPREWRTSSIAHPFIFEAVQALQSVFLRAHAEVLIENEELQTDMEKLLEIQQRESERILELIASSLGTLSFVQDRS